MKRHRGCGAKADHGGGGNAEVVEQAPQLGDGIGTVHFQCDGAECVRQGGEQRQGAVAEEQDDFTLPRLAVAAATNAALFRHDLAGPQALTFALARWARRLVSQSGSICGTEDSRSSV